MIVHGSKDIVVLAINAFPLAQHLPDAQLVMHAALQGISNTEFAADLLQSICLPL